MSSSPSLLGLLHPSLASIPMSWLFGLLLLVLFWVQAGKLVADLWVHWQYSTRLVQHCPGYKVFFHPHTIFAFLPRFKGFNLGDQYLVRAGYSLFSDKASDVVSLVSFFPPRRAFILADPVAIKYVAGDRIRFPKPQIMYRQFAIYGDNTATSEGEVWRRHRRITAGTFAESANSLWWEETVRIVERQCIEGDWEKRGVKNAEGKNEIVVPSIVDLVLKFQLFVISAASFSHRAPWDESEEDAIPEGQTMTLEHAMHGVLDRTLTRILAPRWAYKLPLPFLQRTEAAFNEFESHLKRLINARRAAAALGDVREGAAGKKDLLGALIYANVPDEEEEDKEDAKKKAKLTDEEVLGNVFGIMIAGHETTAHGLAFTLQYLALYQEEQKKLHEHIDEVMPAGVEPDFSYFPHLTRVTACFMEAMRLQPPIVMIPKRSTADAVVPTSASEDGTPATNVFVPRYSDVYLDAMALHRNPKHWGEYCDEFKPDRMIDAPDGSYRWPRDCYLTFSAGHRACIGMKFSSVSACAVLTLLLRRYSIHLSEDVEGTAPVGETFKQKVDRVMHSHSTRSLKPQDIKVVFRERVVEA